MKSFENATNAEAVVTVVADVVALRVNATAAEEEAETADREGRNERTRPIVTV